MNFEEMQMIWDTQKNQRLYAIDNDALTRLVEKDSAVINRDLKSLEIAAIVVLIGLGITTLVDTFFNGDEYFQLFGVAFDFVAAGYLWIRRRKRESEIDHDPANLLERVELAMRQVQTTIQCGQDMAYVFSLYSIYGVSIRMWIYGWRGSEIKLAAALFCIVLLFVCMKVSERTTHAPRLRNLGALRTKLLNV